MPNRMERFTQRARRVLSLAQEAAVRLQHHQIRPEHLLLSLMREEGGVAGRVLRDQGLDSRSVEERVERLTRAEARRTDSQLDLSAGTKKALELAVDEARRLGHHYIGTEHLLLGLVRLQDSAALDILRELNVSPEVIRQQVAAFMQEQASSTERREPPKSFRRHAPSHFDYFLLRTTSRSSGGISHLPVDLSTEVKDALEEALKEVGHTGSLLLEERHLLLGLLHNRDGALRRALLDRDLDLDELIRELRELENS